MGQNSGHNQPVLIILLFFAVFLLAAAGEDPASREAGLFNRGYESYLSYQPEEAVQELTAFLREFPDSSARDAALYWLGKSYMQLKSFGEARKAFSEIRQNFQESPYLSHAERELEILGRTGGDAHIDATAGAGVKDEPPEKRLKEAEKQLKALGKSLREASEERDSVRIQLSGEKKQTDILREKVTQLEKKEKTLNEVSVERDELRRKLDEVKKRVKELEIKEEACEDDAKKLRSREKDLTESAKEKESLSKLLDEERKTTAELRAKNRESEKREKTIKDLIAERDALKTKSEEQGRIIGELQENLKALADQDRTIVRMTDERDTLSRMLGEERKKAEDLQRKIKETENAEKTATLASPSIDEKESLRRELGQEKQKTTELIARIRELEDKEQLVADVIQERDTLKAQLEEQKKMREDSPMRSGKDGAQEKPSALTTPVNKESKIAEAGKREEGQTASQREKQAKETEASSDDTGMMLTRLGIQAVPWRTGNSREEKETERLLYEKARSLKITGETKQLQDLINQHKFDAKQQGFLKRFLAVSEYIDQRLKRLPEEEMIESLIVTYEEENRYTKIVLARELQENAKEGMSFEDIYKLYPDMMRYQIIPSQQMDIRIRDKISNLPSGEVGVLWSEDGYMILKPVLKKLSYDPFLNSSQEMQGRIRILVNEWLQEMKSE